MQQRFFYISILVISLSVGCSHGKAKREENSRMSDALVVQDKDSPKIVKEENKTKLNQIKIQGVVLQNTDFDFPITINSKVEAWVDYFTGRGRRHFEKYLERSAFFVPFIKPILKQNQMPEDLVYLAMIESGFNNHARSFAKAVGPWQFIRGTGTRYGLRVDWWIDERRDTEKSTHAAVRYLKDLYGMFQSWELAASAYNAGENKIARAIQRYGSRDFWEITRHRFLRAETRDYVPKIIAAAIVAKNSKQFGFIEPKIIDLADDSDDGEATLAHVNLDGEVEEEPDEEGVSAGDSKEKLANILEKESVDTETQDDTALSKNLAEVLAQQVPSQKYTKGRMMPSVDRKGVLVTGEGIVQIEVKSPVDLQSIADASDVSYPLVKSLNPEIVRWCTPPDQKFYGIKLPMSAKEKFLQRYKSKDFQTKAEFATYRLKKGETLGRVANRNKLTAQPLVDLNGISEKKYLPAGSVVLLPIPKDPAGRSIAALDIVDKPSKSKRRRGLRRQKHKAEASRRTQRISVKLSRTISER